MIKHRSIDEPFNTIWDTPDEIDSPNAYEGDWIDRATIVISNRNVKFIDDKIGNVYIVPNPCTRSILYFFRDGQWRIKCNEMKISLQLQKIENSGWYSSLEEAEETLKKFNIPYDVVGKAV